MWTTSKLILVQTTLFLRVVQAESDKITIFPTLPETKHLAKLSCFSAEDRTLLLNGILLAICNKRMCIPQEDPERGYYYNTDVDKAEVTIASLDRAKDGGVWTCLAGRNNSITLEVYTIPRDMLLTKGGDKEGDLARSQTTLQCQTNGCTYPPPTINWYYQNLRIFGSRILYEAGTQEQRADGNCTSPENIYTSSLLLPIYTSWYDNTDTAVTFSCGIEYSDSSRNVYSPESKNIRFSVGVSHIRLQLDLQHLSGTFPLNVTYGKPVTLTCFAGSSRPDPTIEWFIGSEQRSSGTSQTFTFDPKEKDHDKMIYCRAHNVDPNKAVESEKPMLYVRVPVTKVILEVNSQLVLDRSTLIVTSGEIMRLTCIHGTSRPEPIVEWYIGSQMKISSTSQNFIFTASNEHHDQVVYCRAYNVDPGEAVESSKPKLYVKVAVTLVSLSVSTSTIEFYEGFPQSLNCISSPSRPIPTIRWWLDSEQLTDTIITTNARDIDGLYTLTSHISLALWKDDRSRQIYCDGYIDGQHAVSSKRHFVNVWYVPNKPKVMEYGGVQRQFPWFENTTGVLQCYSSDYGNPSSVVTWNNHRGVPDTEGHLHIMGLSPSDNDKAVSCKLENKFTIDKNVQVVSEPVKLDIEYNPIINYNASSTLTVNESQSVYVKCDSIGNPRPGPTRWRDQQHGSLLKYDNVSRRSTGTYTCEASANSAKYGILKSQRQLQLTVQYAPEIIVHSTGSTLQYETGVIACEARGVPAENTFSSWVHTFGDVVIRTGIQGKSNVTHNTLILNRLSLENMGTYVCSASNGIMGVNGQIKQSGYENLHVKGLPTILTENSVFAGEIGRSLNISISFYSDPAIESFKIKRKGKLLANTSSVNTYIFKAIVDFKMYGTKVTLRAHRVHTLFRNLTQEDFSNYTTVLQNSIDTTEYRFQLVELGPPWMVRKFYFNNFIEDQIEFHFDPGFNGGPGQSFVIEYKSALGQNSIWQSTNVKDLHERDSQYRLANGTFTVNITQSFPGLYIYRMYSWNVKGKSPFSDSILVNIPGVTEEETNLSDTLLVSMPVVAGVGGGTAVLVTIIIALVIVILKKRSRPVKPPDGNRSDESDIRRYDIIRGTVSLGGNNTIPNEYEILQDNMVDYSLYPELQECSLANTDIELRSQVGRQTLKTADNTSNGYDHPKSSNVHSYLEPLDQHDTDNQWTADYNELIEDSGEKINDRFESGRKALHSPGNHESSSSTKVDVHSYLEVQDFTVEIGEDANVSSMNDVMHHNLDAAANEDPSTAAGVSG